MSEFIKRLLSSLVLLPTLFYVIIDKNRPILTFIRSVVPVQIMPEHAKTHHSAQSVTSQDGACKNMNT